MNECGCAALFTPCESSKRQDKNEKSEGGVWKRKKMLCNAPMRAEKKMTYAQTERIPRVAEEIDSVNSLTPPVLREREESKEKKESVSFFSFLILGRKKAKRSTQTVMQR